MKNWLAVWDCAFKDCKEHQSFIKNFPGDYSYGQRWKLSISWGLFFTITRWNWTNIGFELGFHQLRPLKLETYVDSYSLLQLVASILAIHEHRMLLL